MNIGGGEAADQMVRMMLSGGEVAVRLGGSALKNMLALSMALAKDRRKISGKVNLVQMLKETRDLRTFPMTPEQFGRAIRTESDTCVVAILDERASPKGRYHQDVLNALPEMPVTNCLSAVRDFIKGVKGDTYFEMCS